MLDLAKMIVDVPTPAAVQDITLGVLLASCDKQPSAPLVFSYDGRPIRPGYHVTEVKTGQFAALDCGGNPEAWSEIFVQLWDIVEGDRTHMLAGKFAAIIRKVSEHVGIDADARLTFEVSDGVGAMQLHRAGSPAVAANGVLTVSLLPRPASCKPRDRWLEDERLAIASRDKTSGKTPCCG